jgi:hypothetical protein
VLFRSVRKYAKTGTTSSLSGIRHSPDDRYGLKIKGFLQGPENDLFFLKNRAIHSGMLPVRHRRAFGIQDPHTGVTGVRFLLILFRSGGRQCHRQHLTTGPVPIRRVRSSRHQPGPALHVRGKMRQGGSFASGKKREGGSPRFENTGRGVAGLPPRCTGAA